MQQKIETMENESVTCLIIGSGPAGYTAAIYASRSAVSSNAESAQIPSPPQGSSLRFPVKMNGSRQSPCFMVQIFDVCS